HVDLCCFFFSSRRRHTRFSRDWSSDVCSSDLLLGLGIGSPAEPLILADWTKLYIYLLPETTKGPEVLSRGPQRSGVLLGVRIDEVCYLPRKNSAGVSVPFRPSVATLHVSDLLSLLMNKVVDQLFSGFLSLVRIDGLLIQSTDQVRLQLFSCTHFYSP